ncbi:MAG: hypothetical protein QF380_00825 [Candidatus Marinimicrobia bacterium]|nr:hypothetical protein [Candidatus Neomarinimicrobiota bacterium]
MKILYISPENTVGTLSLWKRAHEELGNECTFVTLYKSKHKYDPGICLNLPLVNTSSWYLNGRHRYYQMFHGELGNYKEKDGYPPTWHPNTRFEKLYFQFRDWVWHFYIEPAIEKYGLMDYDIYHFDWGLDLYRNCHFAKRIAKLGKPIVCTYHGQDMRTRGVIPQMNSLSQLNLTSELDLLKKHPDIQYLFLPFDTKLYQPSFKTNKTIKICHSPTNRYYKGSETIIPICEKLAERENVEFVLIENMPHAATQKIKQSCDILIDQIHNRGGWGYGMNSIEALSMGLCCVTELVPEYVDFIPDHPFINVTGENLLNSLKNLIGNSTKILKHKKKAREWVINKHDLTYTAEKLYELYHEKDWL